ncbi:toxin [Helicobacter sp. MIT 05-5293]|uniref:hypothetical protein n=1 Tax=Helicobacter sp. MIT 05-5293 TaxID=1548149 RepID=UPI00051DA2F4|nr:hypothetical protein [Helicobacter sp. MIT 05-5293]TLD80954.1 toxin [Helicobacter sp. MIT 05-5293]
MKKLLALILFSSSLYADNPEDLPDFTAAFSLRSALSGDILAPDMEHPNWNLKQIMLDEEIRKSDPFDSFGLGAVQFVNTNNPKMCLGIDESGLFALKSCEEDLQTRKLETIFTIIPTTTSAVQIRSFVLDKTECMSSFINPRLPSGRGIGINPCSVDRLNWVNLKNLMLILPAHLPAKLIEP